MTPMRRSLLDKVRDWWEALTQRPVPVRVPADVAPPPKRRRGPGHHHRGQASIELAVFGSLLLLCLSLMVRMGLSFNQRHEMAQQAFRNAEARARLKSTGKVYDDDAQYFIVRDLRAPDATDTTFGVGSRSRQIASAHVLWAHDLFNLEDDESFPAIFEINHQKYGFAQEDFFFTEKEMADKTQRENANKELGFQSDGMTDEVVAGTATKTENAAGITNATNYRRTETITTYIRTKQDAPAATDLHKGKAITSTLSTDRSVTWTTPH